jgi:hypothetical protein
MEIQCFYIGIGKMILHDLGWGRGIVGQQGLKWSDVIYERPLIKILIYKLVNQNIIIMK